MINIFCIVIELHHISYHHRFPNLTTHVSVTLALPGKCLFVSNSLSISSPSNIVISPSQSILFSRVSLSFACLDFAAFSITSFRLLSTATIAHSASSICHCSRLCNSSNIVPHVTTDPAGARMMNDQGNAFEMMRILYVGTSNAGASLICCHVDGAIPSSVRLRIS